MALQLRNGIYASFDESKLLVGEPAVIQSGDTNGNNGDGLYVRTNSNKVERVAFTDEVDIYSSTLADFYTKITALPLNKPAFFVCETAVANSITGQTIGSLLKGVVCKINTTNNIFDFIASDASGYSHNFRTKFTSASSVTCSAYKSTKTLESSLATTSSTANTAASNATAALAKDIIVLSKEFSIPANAISVSVSTSQVPVTSGYTWFTWLFCATQGWVGYVYPSANNRNTVFYTTAASASSARNFLAVYLCKK